MVESAVQAWIGDRIQGGRKLVPGDEALSFAEIEPVDVRAKDGLALLIGTSPSSGVACLAVHEATCLAAATVVLTAMSAEALCASTGSFHSLLGEMRPHPGQKECAALVLGFIRGSKLITADLPGNEFMQRIDRYAIRTSAQWMGPVIEDLQLAHTQLSTEINSSVDSPLIDGAGSMLHGGNFQAKPITSAMEKVRQGCQSLGQPEFATRTGRLQG